MRDDKVADELVESPDKTSVKRRVEFADCKYDKHAVLRAAPKEPSQAESAFRRADEPGNDKSC